MTYQVNLIKFFLPMDDHLYRIRKAEKVKSQWKVSALLVLFSVVIYVWMGALGMGTDIISSNATALNSLEYEQSKFWFMVGRGGFGVLLAVLVIFVPSLLFYYLTGVPYQKLLIMQQIVLFVMLIERITWVPLYHNWGLDWYVSPMSFGIMASYLVETPWIIYLFGAISIFQVWIIWFQVKYLSYLSPVKKQWLWVCVIFLHVLYWFMAALLAFIDTHTISGWFE